VGDDAISKRLLSDPAMVTHALAVFDALPALAESQRWHRSNLVSRPVILRSGGRHDMVVSPGEGLLTTPNADGVVIELRLHELRLSYGDGVRQGCAIQAPTPRHWRTSCSVSVVRVARQAASDACGFQLAVRDSESLWASDG
jgi:hypothetical protein